MGLLGRLFGRGGPVPEWAAFMNPSDYHAFLDQVEDELRRRQIAHKLDAAEGSVRLTSPRDRDSMLGLVNLAQICHQHPRKEWTAIVGEHVERMLPLRTKSALVERDLQRPCVD